MNAENPSLASRPPRRFEPSFIGLVCGLGAAVGYTASNICLRAVTHCDPVWVSAMKAVPTLVLVGPWLFVLAFRGEKVIPPPRVVFYLLASGLLAHLGGNVVFQWALGIVGIAVAVPLTLGMMIVSGALLGRFCLNEGINVRAALANAVLLIAICILAVGAASGSDQAGRDVPVSATTATVATVAACLSGIAYATLGVAIRYGVSGEARISTTLVSVSLIGFVSLTALAAVRIGWTGMLATAPKDLAEMMLAGLFNALAFLSLTKALQVSSVVLVNSLNASQSAMAFVAGVVLFAEPATWTLLVGVGLTIIGLMLMGKRKTSPTSPLAEPEVAAPVAGAEVRVG